MQKTELFKQNEKLIYKQSWYYARNYNMEFEDIKSQAFLIFCEAVDRFDEKKASFTTFLFHRLRTLKEYCMKEYCNRKKFFVNNTNFVLNSDGSILDMEANYFVSKENTLEKIVFYEIVSELSIDGQKVMKGLLQGDFGKPEMARQRTIGKYRIQEVITKGWGWPYPRTENVWNELKDWWDKNKLSLAI